MRAFLSMRVMLAHMFFHNSSLCFSQHLTGGGYNHHAIGGEVEWTPPLLYVSFFGHRLPANLKAS